MNVKEKLMNMKSDERMQYFFASFALKEFFDKNPDYKITKEDFEMFMKMNLEPKS